MGRKASLTLPLSVQTWLGLVTLALLSGIAVAVGPTLLDGPVTVHQAGDYTATLCLESGPQTDCLRQSAGGGFYRQSAQDSVHALDGSGHLFAIPGQTPELHALFVNAGAQVNGPPLLYRQAGWSGNVCVWANMVSNGGLTVYLERAFPPGWKNGSIVEGIVAKPGTTRPAFVTWLDGDPLDGILTGIITDALGVADYDRCYKVNVWAMADPPP